MLQIRELPQVQIPDVLLPYDESSGRLNIEKAAYLGFAKAQLKMGAAYELCAMGCEFDPALSLHYNSLAARQGEPEAEMAISKWFLCGFEGIFNKNEELAYTYAERAAQSSLGTAEFAMGYFNEIGMHVPVNVEKAKEWYQKAAKNGNADAQQRIEGLNQEQTLSKQDHEQVAISKIRSQYGSKRGQRPERFKTKIPDLPTISDADDWSSNRPPARSASTAPYPLSGEPPVMDSRSASVAPYPLNNGPLPGQGRGGPAGGFFNPPMNGGRHSDNHGGQQHLDPYGQPQRPATTVNDSRGRAPMGGPLRDDWDRPQQGPPQGRGGFDPRLGPGRGPSPGGPNRGVYGPDQRANSLSPRPSGSGRPSQGFGGPQSPVQDIGYVAPLAPRNGPRPQQGYGPGPGQPPQRPGHQQDFQRPHPQANRPPGPGTPQSQQSGYGPSQPQRNPGGRSNPGGSPNPQGGPNQRPPPQRQHQAPAQPKPAAPPTGNGPKTFAEMGIPSQQKEGDCVSLFFTSSQMSVLLTKGDRLLCNILQIQISSIHLLA